MPLFQYSCSKCKYDFELQYIIDLRDYPTTRPCPNCGEFEVKKVIGNNGGFRLKGSCWERDGYSTCVGDDSRYKAGDLNIGGK